ncbi:MAG: META domain-containing protein [Rikenellaceae bacterium]|jgi:heat shock protein HslJ|nr:META domain-containing protein [Rikenellaceae bacterium]
MKRTIFITLFLSLLLLSSCCGCRKGPRMVVEGSSWTLNEMGGTVIDNSGGRERYTLTLGDDLRYNGIGDCNRFSGTFQLKEGVIAFSPAAATRMGCLDGAREAAYFGLFDKAAHYAVDREFLILMDAEHRILASFRAVVPETPDR